MVIFRKTFRTTICEFLFKIQIVAIIFFQNHIIPGKFSLFRDVISYMLNYNY